MIAPLFIVLDVGVYAVSQKLWVVGISSYSSILWIKRETQDTCAPILRQGGDALCMETSGLSSPF